MREALTSTFKEFNFQTTVAEWLRKEAECWMHVTREWHHEQFRYLHLDNSNCPQTL